MDKIVKVIGWGILFFFFIFIECGFGEGEIERPTADMDVENLVPLDFAKKIAFYRATKEWGKIAIGNPIIGCDKDGKVVVYIFPVKLNSQIFPSDDTIIQQIEEARSAYLTYQKTKMEKRDIEKEERLMKKIWGVNEFGTVAVAARKDLHPIFEVSNVLPRYYTTEYLAKRKVQEKWDVSFKLHRLFYISPLDQFYEFTNGERKILVNAFNLDILTPEDFQHMIEKRKNENKKLKSLIPARETEKIQESEEKIKKIIEEKWKKYEEELNGK